MRALEVPELAVPAGSLCGIAGPSGSGKTTLLHLAGGLLVPGRGSVRWGDVDLATLTPGARDGWRRRRAGFVFQDFCLVPELSARDNVLLPQWFTAWSARGQAAAADALLAELGVRTPGKRAGLLSRGEQQRVAIARAVFADPAILLADEPTASLDAATAAGVADLLVAHARSRGATLLVVSHDPALLDRMDRVVRLERGQLA